MAIVLTGITGIVVLLTLFLAWKHPHLRRMALRNIKKNKATSLLTVIGAMVGTALITTSLLLSHSIHESGDRFFQEQFGEIVADLPATGQKSLKKSYFTADDFPKIKRAIQDTNLGGMLPIAGDTFTLIKPDSSGRPLLLNPQTYVYGFDFNTAKEFDPKAMREFPQELKKGEIVLSSLTAEQLEAKANEQVILIDHQGRRHSFIVKSVVKEQGLSGYRGVQKAQSTAIVSLDSARSLVGMPENGFTNLLFKNRSQSFLSEFSSPNFIRFATDDWEFYLVQNLARLELENIFKFIPFFFVASINAIFIGILLIYHIFKMMAEERRQEWGILRAIGMTRGDLSRLLHMEGMIYALTSAGIGVIAGIGLSRVLLSQMKETLHLMMQYGSDLQIRYEFYLDPYALLASFSFGVLFVSLCVWIVARKAGKRPIVDALQMVDRRESPSVRHNIWKTVRDVLVLVGAISLVLITSTTGYLEMVNQTGIQPLIHFAVGFLLVVFTVLSLTSLFSHVLNGMSVLFRPFPRVIGILKLAFRYPEVYRTRTGLLLLMFSLVLFLISFSSVFTSSFAQFFGQFDTRKMTGGFDLTAIASRPISTEEVQKIIQTSEYANPNEIDKALSVLQIQSPEQTINGIDLDFAKTVSLKLIQRDLGIGSDQEAWRKVAQDPNSVIVSETVIGGVWDEKRKAYFTRKTPLKVGDPYPILINGKEVGEKKIIGIAKFEKESYGYEFMTGIWVKASELMPMVSQPQSIQSHVLIRVKSQNKLKETQKGIEKTFNLHNIFQLKSPKEQYLISNLFLRVFFGLFEGFNALGTLIGVVGLMVIMFRLVRERRQQIGMLRAIGIPSRAVFWSIWLEGAVIVCLGISLGILIGSYSGYLMVRSLADDGSVAVLFPWLKLALYFAGAFLFTLICAMIPARKAVRLSPAEATRYVR